MAVPEKSDEIIGQGIAQWLDFNSEMVKRCKGKGPGNQMVSILRLSLSYPVKSELTGSVGE